jgi:hypothetical protein
MATLGPVSVELSTPPPTSCVSPVIPNPPAETQSTVREGPIRGAQEPLPIARPGTCRPGRTSWTTAGGSPADRFEPTGSPALIFLLRGSIRSLVDGTTRQREGLSRASAGRMLSRCALPWIPSSYLRRPTCRELVDPATCFSTAIRLSRVNLCVVLPGRNNCGQPRKHLKKSRSSGYHLSCCNAQETRHLGAIAYPAKSGSHIIAGAAWEPNRRKVLAWLATACNACHITALPAARVQK